jgi:hypothetical protein
LVLAVVHNLLYILLGFVNDSANTIVQRGLLGYWIVFITEKLWREKENTSQ